MANKLRQLNVSYLEAEDRLLLKVSTSDHAEYRAWCTRRFTRLLLERLDTLFETEMDVESGQVVPEEARREVAKLQHTSKVSEAAFERPYEAEPATFPLGEQGLLLTRIGYKQTPEGQVQMNLSGAEGKGLTLNMDTKLLHHLYELLTRGSQRAGWFEQSADSGKPVFH